MDKFLKEKWNFLKIDNKAYVFKFVFDDNEYDFLAFDFVECALYHEKKNSVEILKLMTKLNPSIEAPANKIIQHLKQSLTDTDFTKFEHFGGHWASCLLFVRTF
jgi:hypothetical protein